MCSVMRTHCKDNSTVVELDTTVVWTLNIDPLCRYPLLDFDALRLNDQKDEDTKESYSTVQINLIQEAY